ncbi:MAG: ABC transporter ATP-binding protein [Clostridia bacterium]|nr:ABC transporter ATP-binding protein [Clostridia bacterium]
MPPRPGSFNSKMGGRRAEKPLKTLLRLFRYFKHCTGILIVAILSILAYSLASNFAVFKTQDLVKTLEDPLGADMAKYAGVLIGMGFLYAIAAFTNFLLNRLMLSCSARVMCALRKEMFEKMQQLPIAFFDGRTHGELMSYYTNDTEAVNELLHHSITQMLISVTSLAFIFGLMSALSIPVIFIMICMGFTVFYVMRGVTKQSRKNFKKQQRELAGLNGYIEEMMEGQKVVKVFTHEEEARANFKVHNDELCKVATDANTFASIVGPLMNNISHIFYAITCTVGVLLAAPVEGQPFLMEGTFFAEHPLLLVESSKLITSLSFVRQVSNRISQISQQFNSILLALAGAERIFALVDTPAEIDEGDVTLVRVEETDGGLAETDRRTGRWAWKRGEELIPLRGEVRFNDVDFSYDGKKQVLSDVTLYAHPGQKIAFVGSTGAGKTTITNLINRFYDITDGTITYDGIPVREIKKSALRSSLGMVLQDTHLFSGTVMENIRYGRLDATDEECIEAAKIANADFFISHLPDGYATQLVADGTNLSQGQRQLLAIARAAVSDPPVLILDEATSSIDTRTEKHIEKGMDALMKGRTVFVIAHRLSTVRNSDCIMVLENGRIIERGDHEALLKQRGKYYELCMGKSELS